MTEKEIHTEVALLKQDTNYIQREITEIKSTLEDIKKLLSELKKDSHDPNSCVDKFITKKELNAAGKFMLFVIAFSALVTGLVIGSK